MKVRLATYNGDQVHLAFPLTGARALIGRDAGSQVQLPHPEVSKRHAALEATEEGWVLEDLESSNGTRVNDLRIRKTLLKAGDRVQCGPFVLVFEMICDAEEWAPTRVFNLSTGEGDCTMVRSPRPVVDPHR